MQGLYRGKSLLTDKWVYGSLLTKGYHCWIIDESVKTKQCMCDIKITSKPVPVDLDTVGQCIGVKETAGAEFFEGDIATDGEGNTIICTRIPGIYSSSFWWTDQDGEPVDDVKGPLAKIGNIWDNPELLSH